MRGGWETDGIADCCERREIGVWCYTEGYQGPNTGSWVCDGSTLMLTSNETGLLRSLVKLVADPQWPP